MQSKAAEKRAGALARLLAGLEVYLRVILGGLVLYALIKRAEL